MIKTASAEPVSRLVSRQGLGSDAGGWYVGIGVQIRGMAGKYREESHPSYSFRLWWRPGLWLEEVQHHLVATQTWEDFTKCSL